MADATQRRQRRAKETHQRPKRQTVEVGASHGAPLRLDCLYRARRGTANLQVDGLQRLGSLGCLCRCLADTDFTTATVLTAGCSCSPADAFLRFHRK